MIRSDGGVLRTAGAAASNGASLRDIARIVLQSAGVDDVGIEDIQRIGAPERIVVRCAIDAAYDGKRMTRCRNPGGATVRRFREKLAECRRTA